MKIFSPDVEAVRDFDWEHISGPLHVADLAIKQALGALDGSEEYIFHSRMRVLRAARKLRTWERCMDPEVDRPFASMEVWIKRTWPKSYRYAKDAWETEAALDAVPMDDLKAISGANLKVLADEGLSSGLRSKPEVLEAAKNLTKEGFVGYLNQTHQQHIEPIRVMPKAASDRFEASFARLMERHECNRAEGFEVLADLIDENYPISIAESA